MKQKLRFSVVLLILCTLLTVLGAAAEVFPNSTTGVYEYTYAEAEPNQRYTVIMLEGLYNETETPTLDPSGSNVLYFSTVRADADGLLSLSILPSLYRDATVYLSGLDAPVLLFHAKAGDATEIADFTVDVDTDEYVLTGDGNPVFVRYTVDAIDSFGFSSTLPSFAVRAFDNYTGEKMRFVEGSNTILVYPDMDTGTYSFTVTYGTMSRSASFTLTREASEAQKMAVTVNGAELGSNYYIDAESGLDTTVFDPEYLQIEAQTFDQFDALMEDDYTFEYTFIDDEYIGDTQTIVASGSTARFYPPEEPGATERLVYSVTVRSEHADPSSSKGLPFEKTFRVTVIGSSLYKDTASYNLFTAYISAENYLSQIENGSIVIADDGSDLPATVKYVKKTYADALRAQAEEAAALLRLHQTEPQDSATLQAHYESLTEAERIFRKNLYNGSIAMIEALEFESDFVRLPSGREELLAVDCTPSRPSEKILYESSDPTVAKVDEKGNVTTLAVGKTRITASNTDGSIMAYYDLEVYTAIRSLAFSSATLNLVAGETVKATLQTKPAEHGDTITFTSSKPKIVAVSADGKLTALTAGEAVITATNETESTTASLTVTVTAPTVGVTSNVRAKPGSAFTVKLRLAEALHFGSMKATVSYPDGFTFVKAVPAALGTYYTETVEKEDGTLESSWSFDNLTQTALVNVISYEFSVDEETALGSYDIDFTVTVFTPSGDSILANSFSCQSDVTVGETDTYTVTVKASGNGTVSGGGEYKLGESVTVTATPDSNHTLTGWYLNNSLVYSGLNYTFEITDDVTLTAKFAKKAAGSVGGGGGGGGGGGTVTLEKVKPVVASIASGVVERGTKIKLTTDTSGAVIYYTLNGSTPSGISLRYESPIEITEDVTICAIAIKNSMTNSDISTFVYRLPEEEEDDKKDETDESKKDDDEKDDGKSDDGEKQTPTVSFRENVGTIRYLSVTGSYFRPNDPTTRYEVVDMLGKLFDITGVTPSENTFDDVAERYADTIELLVAAGVINGYEDGSFGGGRSITRAEFVKMLAVLLGLDKGEVPEENEVTLSDIDEHWAKDYILRFVAKGYILGYPEGDFRPDKSVTRAEAVTVLNRVIGLQKESALAERFRDLPADFWAYDDIMNAVAD